MAAEGLRLFLTFLRRIVGRIAESLDSRTGQRGFFAADFFEHGGRGARLPRTEGQDAYQQFVEDYAERVDVGAGVDVALAAVGLLGAHVVGRADDAADFGVQSGFAEARAGGFGEAEVDDFRNRFLVDLGDQHVRRLEIAMDDGFLMRVLHSLADLREQREAIVKREAKLVAVLGDGQAGDVLHDEVGAAFGRGAGIEHLGDVGMFHERQRLAFGLEAGDDGTGVHAGLDQLDRHDAVKGRGLLGAPDFSHAPDADPLHQPVRADGGGRCLIGGRGLSVGVRGLIHAGSQFARKSEYLVRIFNRESRKKGQGRK